MIIIYSYITIFNGLFISRNANRLEYKYQEYCRKFQYDILKFFCFICLAILNGCGEPEPSRYRMTVEILTPAGVVSGSSVREVRFSGSGDWFPFGESKAHADIVGEAVGVELPSGQVVYALLAGQANDLNYASGIMGRTLGINHKNKIDKYEIWPNSTGSVHDLPLFAYFQDKSDPTSFKVISKEEFESNFGDGVNLKSLFIEKTNDSIKWEIASDIPSVDSVKFNTWFGNLEYDDPRQMIIGGLVRGKENGS